ncbi:LSM domain-containing protein [Salinigranum halophilum]|jgi:small nuclear ribonucleoprotein|uniref:LSM domain-containing protein n=1 Tax=Salinigranum halophilum TaxID=2565931 RepID=UPI0010A94AE4|nr:LSM domain-containing protein [Salinigranum halophilum]
MSGRPLDVLEASLDALVTVHLKDGTIYHGVLAGYDQHMNLVLENDEMGEDVHGDLDATAVQDTTIIRGDNVVTITT